MKRPSYREAITWLRLNDDTDWVHDKNGIESVCTCLVADLFGVDTDRVTRDLRREIEKF